MTRRLRAKYRILGEHFFFDTRVADWRDDAFASDLLYQIGCDATRSDVVHDGASGIFLQLHLRHDTAHNLLWHQLSFFIEEKIAVGVTVYRYP